MKLLNVNLELSFLGLASFPQTETVHGLAGQSSVRGNRRVEKRAEVAMSKQTSSHFLFAGWGFAPSVVLHVSGIRCSNFSRM